MLLIQHSLRANCHKTMGNSMRSRFLLLLNQWLSSCGTHTNSCASTFRRWHASSFRVTCRFLGQKILYALLLQLLLSHAHFYFWQQSKNQFTYHYTTPFLFKIVWKLVKTISLTSSFQKVIILERTGMVKVSYCT